MCVCVCVCFSVVWRHPKQVFVGDCFGDLVFRGPLKVLVFAGWFPFSKPRTHAVPTKQTHRIENLGHLPQDPRRPS